MSKFVKLLSLPLGSWFRYQDGGPAQIYVLLGRADSGLVANANVDNLEDWAFQGVYSAADSAVEFRSMLVEHVQIKEVP